MSNDDARAVAAQPDAGPSSGEGRRGMDCSVLALVALVATWTISRDETGQDS